MVATEIGKASVELVDPILRPDRYGPDELLGQLSDLGVPQGDLGTLDALLRHGDRTKAADKMRALLSRYTIIEAGETEVDVPLFTLTAPDVPEAEVSATLARSGTGSGSLTFEIAGSSLGANAEVTVSEEISLSAESGKSFTVYVVQPVLWQRRQDPVHKDLVWTVVEPDRIDGPAPLMLRREAWPANTTTATTEFDGGSETGATLSLKRSRSITGGGSLKLGVKVPGIDLGIALEVSAKQSQTVELAASLPSGFRYRVEWLAGPAGVRIPHA